MEEITVIIFYNIGRDVLYSVNYILISLLRLCIVEIYIGTYVCLRLCVIDKGSDVMFISLMPAGYCKYMFTQNTRVCVNNNY